MGFIGLMGPIGFMAAIDQSRTGERGKKAKGSGKKIESSGDTGRVWRKLEAIEARGSNPKTSKPVKKQQKNKQYQEAKMVISLPAPGISWLRDVF